MPLDNHIFSCLGEALGRFLDIEGAGAEVQRRGPAQVVVAAADVAYALTASLFTGTHPNGQRYEQGVAVDD
jgi:hypothetical protein